MQCWSYAAVQLILAVSCAKDGNKQAGMGCIQHAHVMHADAAGAYVSTHDVLLQLLRVKLLALSVVTHKPLVTVGDVKTTVQCTLQGKK